MNVALKLAIWTSGKTQKQIAIETEINESRLSNVVQGWLPPRSTAEAIRIAWAVDAAAKDVFPREEWRA